MSNHAKSFVGMPAPLVEVWRGPIVESLHRGHLIAIDGSGQTIATLGAPETFTYLRSSGKPFQAIPVIVSGAADRFGFTEQEIAVACGSHSGEPIHVDTVRAMLAKIGTGSPSGVIAIHPTVNGVAVEPSSGGVTFPAKVSCEAIGCFKTGTWWLDIDAAESAHSGMFVNQPLNVVLVGVESSANAEFNVAATITARLQKK